MKTRRLLAVAALWLLMFAGSALAGVVSPQLEAELASLKAGDMTDAFIVLDDQADIKSLDADLRAGKATLATRHQLVVEALQKTAARSQGALLQTLENEKGKGKITHYKSYWIMNAIIVRGEVETLRSLAARADVASLEMCYDVEPVQPVSVGTDPLNTTGSKDAVTPHLEAINVPQVWSEFGLDGSGVVVGIIDDGVDGDHEAYGDRWRGHFAPPEECWLDVANTGSPVPVNLPYVHGTHVMGTITGSGDGTAFGVAPEALWIATNAIRVAGGDPYQMVWDSFEFMADPDGDPSTSADLPDVVNNSWQIHTGCELYFQTVIANCEAAGVALVFIAGNDGPGSMTIVSPASYAFTPTSSFSVGAVHAEAPYPLADFSSRGPSACGGPYEIKPEVTAPGVDVYSAQPGDTYALMSGTSMAGPHVSGVMALMRDADPDLDVVTMKEVLMSTAVDLGEEGEDNMYGHGLIDAYAAVAAVMDGTGMVGGTVRDAITLLPIRGAVVTTTDSGVEAVTDKFGNFSMTLMPGARQFSVTAFGHVTTTFSATVNADAVTTVQWSVASAATAVLGGTVTDVYGAQVAGATVAVVGTSVSTTTGAGGDYSLTLPAGGGQVHTLEVDAGEAGQARLTVEVLGNMTLDISLSPRPFEDFETGDLTRWSWFAGGMEISTSDPAEGSYCVRSLPLLNSGYGVLILPSIEVLSAGDFTFSYQCRIPDPADHVLVYAEKGGVLYRNYLLPASAGWTDFTIPLEPGVQSLWFWVKKVGSPDEVEVSLALDDMVFPESVLPYANPELRLSATQLNIEVDMGETLNVPLHINNDGLLDLHWSATIGISADKALSPRSAAAIRQIMERGECRVPREVLEQALGQDADADKRPGSEPSVSLSAASGTVVPGGQFTLYCQVNALNATAGFYTRYIHLSTDDPENLDVVVPVTITVVKPNLFEQPTLKGGLAVVPNPFNPMTNLSFALAQDKRVALEIFDLKGHRVRTLENADLPPGEYTYTWRGKDDAGSPMASGVYHARLRIGGESFVRSLTLVR